MPQSAKTPNTNTQTYSLATFFLLPLFSFQILQTLEISLTFTSQNSMNQFHIYEAIHHGNSSTIYKGRKKNTMEYVAIKRVDKSLKNKVLQEVRILHALDHPKCTEILLMDDYLPEDSIHDLACDIVKALQFLHSKGIICCDFKPSHILIDESGHAKLCDFGLAMTLSDMSETPSSSLPQAKLGTPCYMAPELFQDGGVHSYASDFWALGCVLYECYAGEPPFVGQKGNQIAKSVLSDPIPSLPGNPSRPFVNLVNSLLVKDPAKRLQWAELCGHEFWRTKFTPVPMPPQPASD